jgi:hypothetical protein
MARRIATFFLSRIALAAVAGFLMSGTPAAAGDIYFVSGGASSRVGVKSMAERKFSTIVRQKYDFSCGSAAIATLLTHHYGRATSEEDAFRSMWDVGDQARIRQYGFSLLEMKRYLESIGYKADGFKLTLDRVAEIGAPGVALIDDKGYRHFVVVKGVVGDKVLVGDPARGLRMLTAERFAGQWDGTILYIRSDLARGKMSFNARSEWRLSPTGPTDRARDVETLQSALLAQTRSISSSFSIVATGTPLQ